MLLHTFQAKNASRDAFGPELEKHGYAICHYFEALEIGLRHHLAH